MKRNVIFFLTCLLSVFAYSQDDDVDEINNESIFTDFRIPIRENISESDLKYDGWKTDAGMYTFRCRNRKRIRLTLWYLTKGDAKVQGSEFINITTEMQKCSRKDLDYVAPATENISNKKQETTKRLQ